jgi:phage/plasmid-like protein (TIGR03299 family)
MVAAVETMAYSGQVPWHGLGVRVSNDLSVDEMLVAAGLDWTVQKVPTFYRANREIALDRSIRSLFKGQKQYEEVEYPTGKMALIRDTDNKILSTVSGTWEPCQNDKAFEIFEEFVDRNELEMHTAGSLKGGQLVWCLAKMNESFVLFDDDRTEQYLLLVNPHIFGKAIHIRNTPIRVVCNNTLSLSLSQEVEVQANQTHRNVFDPEAMKEAIGVATLQMHKYGEMARFLGSKQYGDQSVQDYFDRVFPNMSVKRKKEHSRNADIAMQLLDEQPGAEFGRGTWWQAFNTVTYMADHVHGKSTEQRMNSAWFGVNAKRKVDALNDAIEFAEAA